MDRGAVEGVAEAVSGRSRLSHWPVQLTLVPPNAPFLRDADLLLVADCVPFAMAEFHGRFLNGHPVVVGCPKLDDVQSYVRKLRAIFEQSSVRSLTIIHMEVPCCGESQYTLVGVWFPDGSDIRDLQLLNEW